MMWAYRWDYSRYNVVVQQVEGASDLLRDVLERIRPLASDDSSLRAQALVDELMGLIRALDAGALRMLANYDIAARAFLSAGVYVDPRRGVRPVDEVGAPVARIEAAKEAAGREKGKKKKACRS